MKKIDFVYSAILIVLLLSHLGFAAARETEAVDGVRDDAFPLQHTLYTVQAGSYTSLSNAQDQYDFLIQTLEREKHDFLRIEKIGNYYTVRLGAFHDNASAEAFLATVSSDPSHAIILKAFIKKERIVRLSRGQLTYQLTGTEKNVPVSSLPKKITHNTPEITNKPPDAILPKEGTDDYPHHVGDNYESGHHHEGKEMGEADRKINYDHGLNKVLEYRKTKNFGDAERLLKEMLTHYHNNTELLQLLAQTLFWEKKYDKSINVYERLLSIKPSASIREEMQKVVQSREDLFYRANKNYLMAGWAVYDYSNGTEDEKNYTLRLRQRIADKTFVFHYSHINRFGDDDSELGLAVYSRLGEKTKRWGYLAFTASAESDFLARWTTRGAVHQGYKRFDFSLGYTYMEFRNSSVNIIIPGIIAYLPYRLNLLERLYINPRNSTLTLLSKLNYEPNHHIKAYYSFAFGQSLEEITAFQDAVKIDTVSHGIGAELRMKEFFSIGAEYRFNHREKLYDREGIHTYAKYWW